MSPAANPTLVEIAHTIVAAAALHDEDPLDVASGAAGSRARWLAFAALIEAFPDVYFYKIAKWCGVLDHRNAIGSRSHLKHNRDHRKWKWWREDDLATVKDALARAIAETDRAPPEIFPASLEVEKDVVAVGAPPVLDCGDFDSPLLSDADLDVQTEMIEAASRGAETALPEPEKPAEPGIPAPVASAPKPEPPKPSPAAFAIADFARSIQAAKNGRPGARIVDHRDTRDAAALTAAQFGDPPPGRREMLEQQQRSEKNASRSGSGDWS